MASPSNLTCTCYHHLHQHNSLSPKVSLKNYSIINHVKKNSIFIANSSSIRSIYKFKAKSSSVRQVKKQTDAGEEKKSRRVRILIAGGGVGGLVLAFAAKERGFEVMVFEKDLSAVRGEGRHRGPIQLLSSALGVLMSIHKDVAKQVMNAGCVTMVLLMEFPATAPQACQILTPATKKELPVTLVISRTTLQEILLNAVGDHIVYNNSKVVNFSQDSHQVVVTLDDGRQFEGDILVGADGIWSEVRKKLLGPQEASYSGYTCYSGLADYVPSYTNSIGYRVFLGSNQYFVACDVGNAKMQWYAFHKEPPRRNDPAGKKTRLFKLFGSWCSDVTTLIGKTREEMVLRRDIYDRDMIYLWGSGRVTLIGDAAHPLQPNFELGGCLAIEDCHQLILEPESIKKSKYGAIKLDEIASALKRYEQKRMLRTMIVHGVTRMASKSLSSYQPLTSLSTPWLPLQDFESFLQLILSYFLTWLVTGQD